MIRILRMAAALLCAASLSAFASTSSMTATVTDTDGQTWGACAWSAVLSSPVPPTMSGTPVSQDQLRASGTCSASGVITATLLDTSSIDQKGAVWVFKVAPNASGASATVSVAVTGASPNLTANFSSVPAPRFPAGPKAYGYADIEVTNPALGDTYVNTGTVCGAASLRQYSNAGWQCGGSGGGSSLPSTTLLFKGNNAGGALAATPGTDYSTPTTVAASLPNRVGPINLVCEGDSRIAGFGLSSPSTENPCAKLSLLSSYSTRLGTYTNNAVSGSTIFTLLNRYDASDHPLSPAVTGQPADFLLQIGINDLGGTGVASYVTGTTGLSGGTLYSDGPVSCSISGGGSFPPAGGATCTAFASGGAVTTVTITAGGAGYTSAPTITLGASQGGGTQATVSSTIAVMTGAVAIGNLQNFITTKLQPDNWTRIIIGTVYPAGAVLANPAFRAAWESYNEGIRELVAEGYATLVVDDASILPDPYDLNVMQSGGLHANITGTTREANSYNDAIWGQGGRWYTPVAQMNAKSGVTGTNNWRCDSRNLYSLTDGTNNAVCGLGAMPVYNGNGATVFGARSLASATGGNLVTAFGDNIAPSATVPSGVTAIGEAAFTNLTSGTFDTAMGNNAGNGCTSCTNSEAIGAGASLGAAVVDSTEIGRGTNAVSGTLAFHGKTITDLSGNLYVNPSTAGTCSVALRGQLQFTAGGTGVKDILQVCAKDASDAYAWRTIY